MGAKPPANPAYPISRRWLLPTLALPFCLLLGASVVSWPWRALGLPGVVGAVTPPAILLLTLTIAAAMYAIGRNLPVGMITWVPAGQGAIVVLTTGFLAGTGGLGVGLAVIVAYAIIYLLVLGIALVIAGDSAKLAISFVAFFVLTQATRFPVFEADPSAPVAGGTLLTLLAAVIAGLEVAVLVWLARRLVAAPDEGAGRFALAIAGLTLAHGLIAGWEDPVLRGALSATELLEQAVRWLMFATIQLGPAAVLIRFRRTWTRV
jgi:hypothetical protein